MPPLPMSSRISSCGNFTASSVTDGGLNADCFVSVMVSAAAPALSRQAGQSPASAPVGSGVPHCGHLFPPGIGASIFTVSMPTSEAKPAGRYGKKYENIQHSTSNIQSNGAHRPSSWALNVECFPTYHRSLKPPRNITSAATTTRNTTPTSALSRKKATLIQFKLRRRAIQCSSVRQPRMISQPMRYAMRNRHSRPKPSSSPHTIMCARNAAATFQMAVALLGTPETGMTPALRSALYRVIASLHGVEFLGKQTDRSGRRGIGIASPVYAGLCMEVILDPTTGNLLQVEHVVVDPAKEPATARTYFGAIVGQALMWTDYLSSGVVDSMPAMPTRSSK